MKIDTPQHFHAIASRLVNASMDEISSELTNAFARGLEKSMMRHSELETAVWAAAFVQEAGKMDIEEAAERADQLLELAAVEIEKRVNGNESIPIGTRVKILTDIEGSPTAGHNGIIRGIDLDHVTYKVFIKDMGYFTVPHDAVETYRARRTRKVEEKADE